jgi:hypothetical protein
MITRRRSKAASAAGSSPQLAKTAKVFAATSELKRKRKSSNLLRDKRRRGSARSRRLKS